MLNNPTYAFKATCRVIEKDHRDVVSYECALHIEILENINKVHYIKEKNSNMNDAQASFYVYQIEINDVKVTTGKKAQKAADFIRRLYYRYDWIIAKAQKSGFITSTENIEELKNNWRELKQVILSSYCGAKVENYLEHLNKPFMQNTLLEVPFSQYLYFGLLFPPIPVAHNSIWQGARNIQLSDFEKESFEEIITYLNTTKDGRRRYKISANILPDSPIYVESFTGTIMRSPGALLVDQAEAEIIYYRNDQRIEWDFDLEMNTLNLC
ncbi:hypothetical protein QTN47_09180 [Danxiaibacter flavus]|uniref:Uncharacterized protein n=1 Tax=Danxiaibacter flavus TaxID=3049108 RepID=A0ABV3ZGP2_9BACT|nr:hypothetical protein QNM32_09180 [Chitinophagaceae bacterium DXS]